MKCLDLDDREIYVPEPEKASALGLMELKASIPEEDSLSKEDNEKSKEITDRHKEPSNNDYGSPLMKKK